MSKSTNLHLQKTAAKLEKKSKFIKVVDKVQEIEPT